MSWEPGCRILFLNVVFWALLVAHRPIRIEVVSEMMWLRGDVHCRHYSSISLTQLYTSRALLHTKEAWWVVDCTYSSPEKSQHLPVFWSHILDTAIVFYACSKPQYMILEPSPVPHQKNQQQNTHMYTYIYICIFEMYINMYICIYKYIHMYMYRCIYVYTYAFFDVHVSAFVYAYIHIYMYVLHAQVRCL